MMHVCVPLRLSLYYDPPDPPRSSPPDPIVVCTVRRTPRPRRPESPPNTPPLLHFPSTPFALLDSSLAPPANADLKPSTSTSSVNRVMATTSKKSLVTTHILVASKGIPGKSIPVKLEFMEAGDVFTLRAVGTSDSEGRCNNLLGNDNRLKKGTYRLTFHTKTFFENLGEKCFYPYVTITFEVTKETDHYHIPLLISPYSYTTYRGT